MVLTFNLVHIGSSPTPALQDLVAQQEALTRILTKWKANRATHELPDHLTGLLSHEYPETNLRFDHLKGADRKRVGLLAAAASDAGFALFLCNVEKSVFGSVEDQGYGYDRYGWDDEEEDEDERHHFVDDVIEETLKLI